MTSIEMYEWPDAMAVWAPTIPLGFFGVAVDHLPEERCATLKSASQSAAGWTEGEAERHDRSVARILILEVKTPALTVRAFNSWDEAFVEKLREAFRAGETHAMVGLFRGVEVLHEVIDLFVARNFDEAQALSKREACYFGPYLAVP